MFRRKDGQRNNLKFLGTNYIQTVVSTVLLSDLTLTDNIVDATDQTVYTFSGRAFGAADANRIVIVGLAFRAATSVTITSITIGGVTATIDKESRNTQASALSDAVIAHAAVPTGTTGDIVLTLSGTAVRCGLAVWTVTKYASATPVSTGGAILNTTGLMSPTLANTQNGFAVGIAYTPDNTNQRYTAAHGNIIASASYNVTVTSAVGNSTWVGLNEVIDASEEAAAGIINSAATVAWQYP